MIVQTSLVRREQKTAKPQIRKKQKENRKSDSLCFNIRRLRLAEAVMLETLLVE